MLVINKDESAALRGRHTCQYLGSLCRAYTAQPTHWSFLMWYPPIS